MVVACRQDHVFYILAGGHNLLVACFFFQIEVILGNIKITLINQYKFFVIDDDGSKVLCEKSYDI